MLEPTALMCAPAAIQSRCDQGPRGAAPTTGSDDARFVLASSHGYGFVTRFENLTGRNKAGKAILSLTPGAKVLQPATIAGSARPHAIHIAPSRANAAIIDALIKAGADANSASPSDTS